MPKPRIPVIETIGLKFYLDTTPDKHKNKTYADFADLMEKQPRPTDVDVATEFGVTSRTIGNWIKVYEKEKERK